MSQTERRKAKARQRSYQGPRTRGRIGVTLSATESAGVTVRLYDGASSGIRTRIPRSIPRSYQLDD